MKKLVSFAELGVLLFVLIMPACKKKQEQEGPQKGQVKVTYQLLFGMGNTPWQLNQSYKHPKTGDTLSFTHFSFYVSNVKLKKEDGTWWSEPESYHLICATCPDGLSFTLNDVPAGKYVGMELLLGVDSLRNVSGAQTGDLSPMHGMFWDWNTGYIMVKAEGTSPQSPVGTFTFHLGGYAGPYSILTTRTFDFNGTVLEVKEDKLPVITLTANVARLWHSSPSVATQHTIHMPGPAAKTMATDFFSSVMFKEIAP